MDYQAIISAPFGALGISVASGSLCGLEFLPGETPLQAPIDVTTQCICAQVQEYLLNPHSGLDIPLSADGTAFQQRVWQILRAIPLGSTITYAELAERVGSGARAVANACGANPIALVIPCHRVVAKKGLGGFMQGRATDSLAIKRWLLAHEQR